MEDSTVDLLLVLGSGLEEPSTFNWKPELRKNKIFIQIDIDPAKISRHYLCDYYTIGHLHGVLEKLIALAEKDHPSRSQLTQYKPVSHHETWFEQAELRDAKTVPLTPQRWRKDLGNVLPKNAIIVSDIGGHMLFNLHYLTIGMEQDFLLNIGFGSMGYGLTTAIGCAVADPKRPVIAIIGDACFTMLGMELITAKENQIPVIWIVENNGMQVITWHGSRMLSQSGRGLECVKFKNPLNIKEIAEAMGLTAWQVTQPGQLEAVLPQALALKKPCVIEVVTDASIVPPLGARIKAITGCTETGEA